MEDNRETFLQDINQFIIFSKNITDKNIIKSKYLELVKKYHPDVNSDANKNILNEYMAIINNTFEKTENGRAGYIERKDSENDIRSFNFATFCQLLKKVAEIGINKETVKDKIFNEYKSLLILEIEKSNKYASEAFRKLFSEEIAMEYKQKINLFNSGITYYMYLLKSVPPNTKEKYKRMPDIRIANKQAEKVADSYLNEYKKYCKEDEYKDAIEIIMEWLKEINIKYRKY
jgi:curved DNA-binding protein CbpA